MNDNASPPRFIEAGIFEGNICKHASGDFANCYSGYSNIASPTLFWADDRNPCDCYYAHFDNNAASLFTDYIDKISQQDSTDWNITLGGSYCTPCTSSNNPLQANLIRAGTEESSQTANITSCSAQKNLQFRNASGVWSSNGWSNAYQGDAYTEGDNGPHRYWVTTDSWLRDFAHGNNDDYQTALTWCQNNAGW